VFAQGGRWCASHSADGTVRVWDTREGEARSVVNEQGGRISKLALSPGGRHVAGILKEATIRVWDADERTKLMEWEEGVERVTDLAFLDDGPRIVCRCDDGTVHVLDVKLRKSLQPTGPGDFTEVFASPDANRYRARTCDTEIVIEDLEEDQPVAWFPVKADELAANPEGRQWAVSLASHLQFVNLEPNPTR
jgi:WD40 repeat protein